MKIYNSEEVLERNSLLKRLTFDISKSTPDEFEDDDFYEDIKCWITFYDETGCVSDDGGIQYLFQNDLPKGMNEPAEGIFSYKGNLSIDEIVEILKKIGFKED